MHEDFFKLILIIDKKDTSQKAYIDFITSCIRSGITCIHLKEENLPYPNLIEFGKSLRDISTTWNIPLITDTVSLAMELNASGVCLKQSEFDIIEARETLGEDKIIGWHIDTLDQVLNANTLPIDFLCLGGVGATDDSDFGSYSALEQVASLCEHPIVAISGVNKENITQVLESGISGISILGDFDYQNNPETFIAKFRNILDKGYFDLQV
ncbi:thiamine monophosphate synthase/TENI family protein [Chlamydia ibidis]|uniref:Thiamine monophosphate synthase/TENI family protein n=2 Tax=Chlamydia ibidis TaxID=1405396 RepID=S7J5R0_9CHLA|nr:thiamine phosphate synthase [Chlamydia ibidis]EPP35422.1 thiamine monophosphate synthase/TENI family protein [Chlamydia ibidis]EQM63166.1 thiamine monophosphate synthase/TENI family protein [Chlamydia ibidis 10-1398/6]